MAAAPGLFTPPAPTAPPVHFIWVGAPAVTGIPGHDIAGPLMMAKQNKTNPLFFWCLEEHAAAYRAKFTEFPHIKVQTIQSLLTEVENRPLFIPVIKKIRDLLNLVTKREEKSTLGRDPIRDYVTLKVEISFLLESIEKYRGYVFDTNIIPYEDKPHVLPNFSQFKIPYFAEVPSDPSDIDCWAMYCPVHEGRLGLELLVNYQDKVAAAEAAFVSKEKKAAYHDALGKAVLDVLSEQVEKKRIEGLRTTVGEGTLFVLITEPGFPVLSKCYFNTHKFEKPKAIPEIFMQASADNLPWVRFFVEQGEGVNQQLNVSGTGYWVGETPLHFALRSSAKACARFLLEKGADPDLEANYDNGKVTARMIITKTDELSDLLPLLKPPTITRTI